MEEAAPSYLRAASFFPTTSTLNQLINVAANGF
jgi:hypothetical protein